MSFFLRKMSKEHKRYLKELLLGTTGKSWSYKRKFSHFRFVVKKKKLYEQTTETKTKYERASLYLYEISQIIYLFKCLFVA